MIAETRAEVERQLAPCAEAIERLQTIPGVSAVVAAAVVAEIGVDRGRFPTAKHLASWAGVGPGNTQSGGKRLGGRTTSGNGWLGAMLGEAAWAIARSTGTDLHAQVHRLARRRGKQKAVVAVRHRVLVIISHVLATGRPDADLGPDSFDRIAADRLERHHVRRLEQLGFDVTLTRKEAA